ncbi:MAG: glycoside hydrolase family 3 N-terminal domain-containing protein [Candidatus Babeliales bacterium]
MVVFFLTLIALLCNISHAQQPPFLTTPSSWAEQTLAQMTLEQKVGQLLCVAACSTRLPRITLIAHRLFGAYNTDPAYVQQLIEEYHVGGVIFLYNNDPLSQMAMTQQFQCCSRIPLLIAQDCEWGLAMSHKMRPELVTQYPHALTLGAITDTNLIYQLSLEIGRQCAAIGVHINLAPVTDVNNNPRNPIIHDRSFGDNPERVAQHATAFARGLHDAHILATAKHFPGHGDTTIDSHKMLPVIAHSAQHLESVELQPFAQLIDNGISAVMTAHLSVPALDSSSQLPTSMSPIITTQLLKNKLGFQGLVITDGMGMRAITNTYEAGYAELYAFLAGADIILCPTDVPLAVQLIKRVVESGSVSIEELDARVLKILRAKEWAHIHERREASLQNLAFLTRPEAIDLQKQLYRAAITVAQQADTVSCNQNLLASSCLFLISKQFNTPIYDTYARYCPATYWSPASTKHAIEECMAIAFLYRSVIIAIGDMHKNAAKNFGITAETIALINELTKAGKTVTVVLFGTPYSVSLVRSADTIIVAYEEIGPAHEAAVDLLRGNLISIGRMPVQA